MNITKKVVDDVNIVLSLEIEKADYAEAVEKQIKQVRKNAQMPGFRKGMVPAGLIRKQYGMQITIDEVNKLINDSMYKYISDNKLNVLGEPMVDESQEPVDFATAEKFTVNFALSLAPEFELTLDNSVKIPYYTIKVSDELVDQQIKGYQGQFGEFTKAEEACEDDVIKGDIAELGLDGNLVEGGIVMEGATVYPKYMANDEEKAKFNGAKKFASIDFNPAAAYNNNAAEIASLLGKKKEEVEGITANFRFTITEINHREEAPLNEDLFTKVFGDECKTEEQFKENIKNMIAGQLAQNSDYKFSLDARKVLCDQVGALKFPEESLKKWLLAKDEKRDAEKLNEDFPKMMEDLTWQLIEEKIVEKNDIKLSDDDMKAEARMMVQAQMAQYGMANIPEEYLAQYAESVLKDEKQRGQLRDSAISRRILAVVREQASLDNKEVSLEEFNELFK